MVVDLKGKRALVTGAASGIGRAAYDALRASGARVAGLDRVAAPDVDWVVADLAIEQEIVSAVAAAASALGGFDILVNCAGIEIDAPLRSVTADSLDRMYAVNVRGAILVAREVLKAMPPGGRIINIASELAFLGRGGASGYCATKGAMLSLTRSWARELAPDIVVNAVAPGPIDTPLLGIRPDEPGAARPRSGQSTAPHRAARGSRRGDPVSRIACNKLYDRSMHQRRWRRCDALSRNTEERKRNGR